MTTEDGAPQSETAALLLHRYRIEAMLGEGGLGTVYRAYDTRLKRMVAVKTLKRALVSDLDLFRSLEERFTREAEAGSRMGTHPHLVTVHDLVVEPDRTQYLIQEYVAGGTVVSRIADGPLPVADALRITADAADGLQSAHDAGIVHRDVKPANLFLTAEGRAKVGDFGIVQIDHISRRTRTTTGHPGTPLYMSPEQSSGTGYVRPESDQYSLGLVLFEMLTGAAYKRLRKAEVEASLASLPDAVRTLLVRMLATDPDERFPTMHEVQVAATQARESLETPARPPRADWTEETRPMPPAMPPAVLPVMPPALAASTPLLNLQPVPPLAPPPTVPPPRHTRRGVLLFGLGAVVAAVGSGGAVTLLSRHASPAPATLATANPAGPTVALAAAAGGTDAPATVASPTTPDPTATPLPTATPVPPRRRPLPPQQRRPRPRRLFPRPYRRRPYHRRPRRCRRHPCRLRRHHPP